MLASARGEGLVAIITTNHRERFDSALLRPGRVDMQEHFTYATDSQIVRLVNMFATSAQHELTVPSLRPKVTPAAIMEHLKRHHDDPFVAVAEINKTLTSFARIPGDKRGADRVGLTPLIAGDKAHRAEMSAKSEKLDETVNRYQKHVTVQRRTPCRT